MNFYGNELNSWYSAYLKEEEQRKRDGGAPQKEDIDVLSRNLDEYREVDLFKDVLRYTANLYYLATYNVMLLYLQKPDATFVLGFSEWWELGRAPKSGCKCLIILEPFGPVKILFDYLDTEPVSELQGSSSFGQNVFPQEKDKLLSLWEQILDKRHDGRGARYERDLWGSLLDNLSKYGIVLDRDGHTLNSDKKNNNDGTLTLWLNCKSGLKSLEYPAIMRIPFRGAEDELSRFHTVCRYLAHFFCLNPYPNLGKYDSRLEKYDFEAETVVWLVCKRHGVDCPDDNFLDYYEGHRLPSYSMATIMRAVSEIERMIHGTVRVKDSPWYRHDKKFKKTVDDFIKSNE